MLIFETNIINKKQQKNVVGGENLVYRSTIVV